MPRPPKNRAPEPVAANAIVASAAQINSKRTRGLPKQGSGGGWQAEAWSMLDEVGELEFYREWIANALSRVTIHPTLTETIDGTTTTRRLTAHEDDPDAIRAWQGHQALFGGESGQSQMMAAFAGHLSIPGESWLVGLLQEPEDPTIDLWRVLSREEVKIENGRVTINRGDDVEEVYRDGSKDGDEPEVYVIRLWRPHPRKWVDAHSSVKSALPILRELLGLTKKVDADINSRLAGAGLLLVPTEATFAAPGVDPSTLDPNSDPLLETIIATMTAALRDRADPSSVAPIVLRVPAQYVDKIKHLTFWSEFSAEARELRKEAITRLANSLDVPAQVLLGLADVNHWTGWLLDDNSITQHVEPLAEVVTHGITTRFLWPILQSTAESFDPALRRFGYEYDTSALRQRPNRSAEAGEGHAALILTDAAYARERGFDATDLLSHPDNLKEYKRRMLERIAAQAGSTPGAAIAALAELGVIIEPSDPAGPAVTVDQVPTPPPSEPPAIDAPRDAPEQGEPPAAAAAREWQLTALVLGCEAVVARAVERGWNKAGNRGSTRRPVAASALDGCLADAWGLVPRIAAMTNVDAGVLHAVLDGYARSLLTTGADHDPVAFSRLLRTRLVDPVIAGG